MNIITLDTFINKEMVLIQGPLGINIMNIITNIFSPKTVAIYTAIIIAFFLYKKKWKQALLFFLGVVGGFILEEILKNIFQRGRPENALITETDYSFPSGHATVAIIFFVLLIYLFQRKIKNKGARISFIAINIFFIAIIGFSRIYLNVHWFTDIIAGYILGLLWISLVIYVTPKIVKILQEKRQS